MTDEPTHIATAADDPNAALNQNLHGDGHATRCACRPASDVRAEEILEEAVCSCGAGHGSIEGHTDWCDFLDTPAPQFARAPISRDALIHEIEMAMLGKYPGKQMAQAVADAILDLIEEPPPGTTKCPPSEETLS